MTQNEKLITEVDKYQKEFEAIVDKIDCNGFKDRIPQENKKRMYKFIKTVNIARSELDKFRDSLFDDEYGNKLKERE